MVSIRQKVINGIVAKLQSISKASGYSRDILSDHVYTRRMPPQELTPPAIVVVQGPEEIRKYFSDMYECVIEVGIAFVDIYNGDDPDAEALEFMADIQKAMGAEFTISVTSYQANETYAATVNMLESASAINVSDGLVGFVTGQVAYEVMYRRHYLYPDKV